MSNLREPRGLLPLDDDRWSALTHAYGPASDVPDTLRAIEANVSPTYSPSLAEMRRNPTPWERIYPLVHQRTVYSAAYAAVPHLVRIGGALPELREQVFTVLGDCFAPDTGVPCPADLQVGWEWAREEARRWLPPSGLTGYPMSFALRGFLALRHATGVVYRIDQIGSGEVEGLCPHCGEYALFELEAVACPPVCYGTPPLDWPIEETTTVARDIAAWAGDTYLTECIAALSAPRACAACGQSFTPEEAAEAEARTRAPLP
ncbi:MAG: hypothetical protein H6726_03995 [Sandaracinaceae bacterium]|nr:hypothetical protein [Myxococcales bacterium]MCB9656789.1 hypothetical protein [Sandaracinaceae bacterium]